MSCYEQFKWTPQTVRNLNGTEASLLAIYFEEVAKRQGEEQRELERNSGEHTHTNVGGEFTTDFELGSLDDEDEDEE